MYCNCVLGRSRSLGSQPSLSSVTYRHCHRVAREGTAMPFWTNSTKMSPNFKLKFSRIRNGKASLKLNKRHVRAVLSLRHVVIWRLFGIQDAFSLQKNLCDELPRLVYQHLFKLLLNDTVPPMPQSPLQPAFYRSAHGAPAEESIFPRSGTTLFPPLPPHTEHTCCRSHRS